jgi:hypothetical protein
MVLSPEWAPGRAGDHKGEAMNRLTHAASLPSYDKIIFQRWWEILPGNWDKMEVLFEGVILVLREQDYPSAGMYTRLGEDLWAS